MNRGLFLLFLVFIVPLKSRAVDFRAQENMQSKADFLQDEEDALDQAALDQIECENRLVPSIQNKNIIVIPLLNKKSLATQNLNRSQRNLILDMEKDGVFASWENLSPLEQKKIKGKFITKVDDGINKIRFLYDGLDYIVADPKYVRQAMNFRTLEVVETKPTVLPKKGAQEYFRKKLANFKKKLKRNLAIAAMATTVVGGSTYYELPEIKHAIEYSQMTIEEKAFDKSVDEEIKIANERVKVSSIYAEEDARTELVSFADKNIDSITLNQILRMKNAFKDSIKKDRVYLLDGSFNPLIEKYYAFHFFELTPKEVDIITKELIGDSDIDSRLRILHFENGLRKIVLKYGNQQSVAGRNKLLVSSQFWHDDGSSGSPSELNRKLKMVHTILEQNLTPEYLDSSTRKEDFKSLIAVLNEGNPIDASGVKYDYDLVLRLDKRMGELYPTPIEQPKVTTEPMPPMEHQPFLNTDTEEMYKKTTDLIDRHEKEIGRLHPNFAITTANGSTDKKVIGDVLLWYVVTRHEKLDYESVIRIAEKASFPSDRKYENSYRNRILKYYYDHEWQRLTAIENAELELALEIK